MILLGSHGTRALGVGTGAAVVASAALSGVGTSLAAVFFSGRHGTSTVGVGAAVLGGFWHDEGSFWLKFSLKTTAYFDANRPADAVRWSGLKGMCALTVPAPTRL